MMTGATMVAAQFDAMQRAAKSAYEAERRLDKEATRLMTPQQVEAYFNDKRLRREAEEVRDLRRREVEALERIARQPRQIGAAGSDLIFGLGLLVGVSIDS